MIFVRHPFERLLSAFRDKLEDPSVQVFFIFKLEKVNFIIQEGDDHHSVSKTVLH